MQDRHDLAEYIISDAVDDFGDVINGISELQKILNDPELERMIEHLRSMRAYVERLKVGTPQKKQESRKASYPEYTGLHWEAQIDRATSQKVYGATVGDYLFVVYPMYHEGEEKYTGEVRRGPNTIHTAGYYNTVKEVEIALERWGADNHLIGTQIARRRNEEKYYAIYYFRGVDYYPATGSYTDVQDVYSTAQEAIKVAKQLAEVFPDTEFGVYPVNHNYEITGRPVKTFNAMMDH